MHAGWLAGWPTMRQYHVIEALVTAYLQRDTSHAWYFQNSLILNGNFIISDSLSHLLKIVLIRAELRIRIFVCRFSKSHTHALSRAISLTAAKRRNKICASDVDRLIGT